MYKKILLTIFIFCSMISSAYAAKSIFPVEKTGIDGITKAGYMDEDGSTAVGFYYTHAGGFAECGLAAVENDSWQTAVINRSGQLVVPYTDSPISVDFSDDSFAYRYKDYSVYYTLNGEKIGSYSGAEGFFRDGLLLRKNPDSGLYSYVKKNGAATIEMEFLEAGPFSGGMALVKTIDGVYSAIDTSGKILHTLDGDVSPVYLSIFEGSTVVLSKNEKQALYSFQKSQYLTGFVFDSISAFDCGAAMVKEGSLWGLISYKGKYLTKPTYYYFSYLGEGLYAARSPDGSASAVDASGNVIYRTPSYVGGFNELRYGLAWHSTEDGTLVFFHKNGGYFASLKNAENPTLLSENVVKVTQDNTVKYINLATNTTLFEQPKTFTLDGGITLNTVHYEKFLGYQADGTEHGWNVDFPEITGIPDENVNKKINNAVREFFLDGPSLIAEYEALEGGYGASLEGCVLVIWANCVSGKGTGASVWNNSLAFDVRTGEQYKPADMFKSNYIDSAAKFLPAEHKIYMYTYPRISAEGVTYFYNEYESQTRRAHTESYLITFGQLWDVVEENSECYIALHTKYVPPEIPEKEEPRFSDVPETHWAYEYVQNVSERGLMNGSNGKFRPDDTITTAEICVTVARSENLPLTSQLADGLKASDWYAKELSAVIADGLTDGVQLHPETNMKREDAMQIFANILIKHGAEIPDEDSISASLKGIRDVGTLSNSRRTAAALCIREGLLSGDSQKLLNPLKAFTRAEFAKLLITAAEYENKNARAEPPIVN